ncbi:hypothetical protein WJX74_002353 [Apatococcus lobatus]|uniref:Uncharacterized protein n=1 Tax=Apatococcus lobatus TaxID=904363 RepID=A0AAW1QV72_9CHLO
MQDQATEQPREAADGSLQPEQRALSAASSTRQAESTRQHQPESDLPDVLALFSPPAAMSHPALASAAPRQPAADGQQSAGDRMNLPTLGLPTIAEDKPLEGEVHPPHQPPKRSRLKCPPVGGLISKIAEALWVSKQSRQTAAQQYRSAPKEFVPPTHKLCQALNSDEVAPGNPQSGSPLIVEGEGHGRLVKDSKVQQQAAQVLGHNFTQAKLATESASQAPGASDQYALKAASSGQAGSTLQHWLASPLPDVQAASNPAAAMSHPVLASAAPRQPAADVQQSTGDKMPLPTLRPRTIAEDLEALENKELHSRKQVSEWLTISGCAEHYAAQPRGSSGQSATASLLNSSPNTCNSKVLATSLYRVFASNAGASAGGHGAREQQIASSPFTPTKLKQRARVRILEDSGSCAVLELLYRCKVAAGTMRDCTVRVTNRELVQLIQKLAPGSLHKSEDCNTLLLVLRDLERSNSVRPFRLNAATISHLPEQQVDAVVELFCRALVQQDHAIAAETLRSVGHPVSPRKPEQPTSHEEEKAWLRQRVSSGLIDSARRGQHALLMIRVYNHQGLQATSEALDKVPDLDPAGAFGGGCRLPTNFRSPRPKTSGASWTQVTAGSPTAQLLQRPPPCSFPEAAANQGVLSYQQPASEVFDGKPVAASKQRAEEIDLSSANATDRQIPDSTSRLRLNLKAQSRADVTPLVGQTTRHLHSTLTSSKPGLRAAKVLDFGLASAFDTETAAVACQTLCPQLYTSLQLQLSQTALRQ